MKIWVLIFFLSGYPVFDSGGAGSAEFVGKEACELAGTNLQLAYESRPYGLDGDENIQPVFWVCLPMDGDWQ